MSPEAERVLLVLSAPTGAGKTTIARRLLEADGALRFSVSHTTRPPRPGERDGVDYHFVDRAVFERRRELGEFLEWAEVHGNLYGTHRSETRRAAVEGRDLVLDIDVQGGLQVRRAWPSAVLVFILPPSLEVLLERLGARGREAGFDLRRRLETAARELAFAQQYDYNVVNEDLAVAVGEVLCILRSARTRPEARGVRRRQLADALETWLRSSDVPGE